MFVSNSMLGLA